MSFVCPVQNIDACFALVLLLRIFFQFCPFFYFSFLFTFLVFSERRFQSLSNAWTLTSGEPHQRRTSPAENLTSGEPHQRAGLPRCIPPAHTSFFHTGKRWLFRVVVLHELTRKIPVLLLLIFPVSRTRVWPLLLFTSI